MSGPLIGSGHTTPKLDGWVGLSGITTGGLGGAECPLDSEEFAKNWEKEGENQEKEGKNREKEEK